MGTNRNGSLQKTTLLFLLSLAVTTSSLMACGRTNCPEDCSKVLVYSQPEPVQEAIQMTVRDVPTPNDEDVMVEAYVEADGFRSDVRCESKGDRITCSW